MNTKKILIIIGIILVAGVGYWLISPLFLERSLNESLEEIVSSSSVQEKEPIVVFSGEFIGLAGHSAGGTAKVLRVGEKYYVRFEDDFKITNGPDLFVYFGKDNQYVAEARIDGLKGSVGSQNYEVPRGISPENFNEIWVWCRAFAVPFGKASLN
ncbi:MAG: DM13 domain-containing protein [Patescibacteria group bacterium]